MFQPIMTYVITFEHTISWWARVTFRTYTREAEKTDEKELGFQYLRAQMQLPKLLSLGPIF